MTTQNIAKNAKNDVKKISPFYYINQLNKLARKNEFCESTNIHELGLRVAALHEEKRVYFSANVFVKDSRGRFCTEQALPKSFVYDTEGDAVTYTYKDKDVRSGMYLQPVTCSLAGFIDAYKKVVVARERMAERIAKKAEKAKKDANKQTKKLETAKRVCMACFGELAENFTNDEYMAKYAIIRAAR